MDGFKCTTQSHKNEISQSFVYKKFLDITGFIIGRWLK